DHVLGAHPNREPNLTGPYTYEHPFHEPMVFFGFLAAITTRLELVTGILILPQRQTALVAKQTAEVDVLSGGRLRLGIGIGWNYVEYDALGEDFRTRGRRVEEQIEVLRKLWTQPLVTHKSAEHVIDNAGINPLPVRRPIPIWFGGAAEPVLRRAARIGDGWMPAGRPPDDRMKGYVSRWVMDHLLNSGYIRERLDDRPYYHPLATLSYLAATTRRVSLGTSVLVLPYHNPVELAKYAASLDQMSGGRVILGVGVGA